jgi:hypothetical protein
MAENGHKQRLGLTIGFMNVGSQGHAKRISHLDGSLKINMICALSLKYQFFRQFTRN